MFSKKVCVVGLGYIGLPTAALLAGKGYSVVGVDVNRNAVDTINDGRIHIVEPDLDAFVRSAVSTGRLRAHTTPQPGDVYMICVPTPFHETEGDPQPNIEFVLAATRGVAPFIKSGDIVILESTSPVGTTHRIAEVLAECGIDVAAIHIAYCPERVLPGRIMTELVENDRVVGGLNPTATAAVAEFYRTFVRGQVLGTDAKTAEMCKLTENSFRDVNIAFANELSVLCSREGINVWELIALANRHPRVNILQPGTGVGGHCIAVDPWFIVARDPGNAQLIRSARIVNNGKTEWVVEQVRRKAEGFRERSGLDPVIGCLGLAFKPDIDDLRESPAVEVVTQLMNSGCRVIAVEPNVEKHPDIPLVDLEHALDSADIVAVLVRHAPFLERSVRERLRGHAALLDFCGATEDGSLHGTATAEGLSIRTAPVKGTVTS